LKLGLIQMKMEEDREANIAKASGMVSSAAAQGAKIVCLPELFDSLYFPQHERSEATPETVPGDTTRALSRIARENDVVLVGGSIFEKSGRKSYNTSVVFDERGRILGKYRKVHVPNDPSFYEQNYFSPGTDFKVFKTKHARVAPLICFDQWYPEPARIERLNGAEIIFYPTAIGLVKGIEQTEGDWHEAWESIQRGHAIANSVIVAAVNRVGTEGEMTFWGGSFVCDQFGKILFRADDKEGAFVVDCDLQLSKNVEDGWHFLRNRKPRTYSRLVKR
jgi:predicted amidohydrolase